MTRRLLPLTPLATAVLALFAGAPLSQAQPPAAASVEASPKSKVEVAAATLPPVLVQSQRDDETFTSGTSSLNKLPANLRDAPQSITVINKAMLQTQGATSLADALRNVPGITLGGAEGGQIGNNINLNGFTARTDVYLDGFRDRGQYYRDLFALDSVEVLMGPSSMLFGRGSTGGVINQVTKKPSLTPSLDVSASVTTNGLVRTTLDVDRPLTDTAAFRVSAMAQNGKPTTRDEMKNRDFGLAPSLKLGIGTPTEITLSALLLHNHDMPDYGVSPLNGAPVKVDRDTFYGFTDDRLVQDVIALSAGVETKLSPTATLRNQTAYNDVRINAVETASNTLGTVGARGFTALVPAATSSLPLEQLAVRLQSHDRVIHDKSLFNQTELALEAATGPFRHALLAGLELGHDSYVNQAYYRNGSCNGVALNPPTGTAGYVACEPLVDPGYAASPAAVARSTGNLAQSSANTIAAYLNDTLQLAPTWKVVGGLRHDRYQASVSNTLNATNTAGNTTLPRVDQTVSFNSVRLGPLWQPTESQSYYASYSTSFNPSLEQLTITTGTTAPLPPEHNRAYELGGKWDLAGGDVALDAAAFKITQYDSRAQGADGTYTATGTVEVRGLRAGASGRLAKGWKVYTGYSFLDAEIVDAIAVGTQGKVPLNTPRHSATIWSTYEFLPHWEVGGGGAWQSSRYVNNTNLVQVPGYVRWDGTLAYRQRAFEVRLNVFNLTNKLYYDTLIPSDGGRGVPGTGRMAMLSVFYHL